MNLSSMLAELYRRTKFAAAPDPTVITRFTAYLNEAQREVIGTKGYGLLRRNVLTFQSVANTPFAVLPQAAVAIVSIQDRVNQWTLEEVSIQDIRADDPGLTSTVANPYQYAVLDYAAAVAQDPSAPCQPYAVSTSASDNFKVTVCVEGVSADGTYFAQVPIAMNGTTPVQIPFPSNVIAITKFYIESTTGTTTASGIISLTQGSGGGALGVIGAGRSFARYTRLQLYPTPTQVNTYYADVELSIADMVNAGDEPYLPTDFHWILVSKALMKEYQLKEKATLYEMEEARSIDGMANLRLWLARRSGSAAAQRRGGFSQLGANYPADGGFYG